MDGSAGPAISDLAWNSEPWKQQRDSLLLKWFGGNRAAFDMMMALSEISELWDDLVDGDKLIRRARLDRVFFKALVDLPCNPFFNEHRTYLMPLIIQSINAWQDANVLELGDRNERALAYTLRNVDIQLVSAIVFITQGYDRMRELSPQIWRLFAAQQDDVLAWVTGEKK